MVILRATRLMIFFNLLFITFHFKNYIKPKVNGRPNVNGFSSGIFAIPIGYYE